MSRQVHVATVTGGGAINSNLLTFGESTKLLHVTVKISGAVTTEADSVVLNLDANAGAAYDCIIDHWEPQGDSGVDNMNHVFSVNKRFSVGDVLNITFPNTQTNTVGIMAYYDAAPND